MMRIDDEKLMAFIDGELGAAEREAVEQALRNDPALREKAEAQRRLRARLAGHYGPVASEEVPERLLSMLGAARPGESVASLSARRRAAGPRPLWRNLGAIAATLAVGFLAGQLVPGRSGPFMVEEGAMIARGDLAEALETQLASAQPAGATNRIGVTFADRHGRACRTFDAPAASGLACREDGEWNILVATAGQEPPGAEYRQAGSSLVLEAAQEMMAGAPLDAEAERAALQSGWKMRRPAD